MQRLSLSLSIPCAHAYRRVSRAADSLSVTVGNETSAADLASKVPTGQSRLLLRRPRVAQQHDDDVIEHTAAQRSCSCSFAAGDTFLARKSR